MPFPSATWRALSAESHLALEVSIYRLEEGGHCFLDASGGSFGERPKPRAASTLDVIAEAGAEDLFVVVPSYDYAIARVPEALKV